MAREITEITYMKKCPFIIILLICVSFAPAASWPEDTVLPAHPDYPYAAGNRKCLDDGGYGQTVFIIPRVYISYIGKSDCWSEIHEVEIPVDFLKLQDIAREEGDMNTYKIMSHENLPDFFTWLLESGRYAMPADALSDILGYVQRKDYKGLYSLYRLFGKAGTNQERPK
jgi:hypothetical protein